MWCVLFGLFCLLPIQHTYFPLLILVCECWNAVTLWVALLFALPYFVSLCLTSLVSLYQMTFHFDVLHINYLLWASKRREKKERNIDFEFRLPGKILKVPVQKEKYCCYWLSPLQNAHQITLIWISIYWIDCIDLSCKTMSIKDDNIPLADDDPQGNIIIFRFTFDDNTFAIWKKIEFSPFPFHLHSHNWRFQWQHQSCKIEWLIAKHVQ